MPRFAPSFWLMFTEVPLLDRFEWAARLGFKACEVQWPYEAPAADVAAAAKDAGIEVVLINLKSEGLAKDTRTEVSSPGKEAEFRKALDLAAEYAEALGGPGVNILAGASLDDDDVIARRDCFVSNMRIAGDFLGKVGSTALIESVSQKRQKGSFIHTTKLGLDAIARIGHPNVKLQFDVFHAALEGEDVIASMEMAMPQIGHIQFSDIPDRHEPGTGSLDWDAIFGAMDRLGYTGWAGAEYVPSGKTEDSLGWWKAQ